MHFCMAGMHGALRWELCAVHMKALDVTLEGALLSALVVALQVTLPSPEGVGGPRRPVNEGWSLVFSGEYIGEDKTGGGLRI
jgi:hypothetical protein